MYFDYNDYSNLGMHAVGPMKSKKKKILTGDRPTGPLHLGHYVGSLANRVKLQDEYDCFFIIADYQTLTDHLHETEKIEQNIKEIVLDWLSIGLDPQKSTFFVQSKIPEIAELTMYFSMLVTVPRLQRNPTVKEEIENAKLGEKMSYGFLGYPVSQAADILIVRADLVPVGEDQLPHVEQTREIVRKFNKIFKKVFPVPEPLIGDFPRLPGIDGQKMSKSRNNAIYLKDSPEEVEKKIKQAITDPKRIHPTDEGHPNVCNVYQYHKAYNPEGADEIEKKCSHGKIGCVECKKLLTKRVNGFLEPIRQKRKKFETKPNIIKEILRSGIQRTQIEARETIKVVREVMHFDYKNLFY